MDLKNMRQVEKLVILTALAALVFFTAGYFISIVFFYCFLVCMLAYAVLWIGFWKCPHCGRRIWFHFDAPCKHCQKNIYEKPEEKPKNTQERTGFFGL